MSRKFSAGEWEIGEGCPVFIIAEIGYNFNTLEEAKKSIDAAVATGADAVKFQSFRADTVTTKGVSFPKEAGGTDQYAEFKKYELSDEWHRELFAYARKAGICVFSTPAHYDDVELLESLGVEIYKTGADDLTNLPLMRYIAAKKKPMIISSGMGNLSEVSEAVETIRSAGNDDIVVLQCVSNYPIEDLTVVNLKAMRTMRDVLGTLAGYSDHTSTAAASIASVALGAVVVERHFTISKDLDAPDAFFSADPEEFSEMVRGIRDTEKMLGNGVKKPSPSETDMRKFTRKSIVSRVPIKAGEKITAEKVIIKRPGLGIPPKQLDVVLARTARRDIPAEKILDWEDL